MKRFFRLGRVAARVLVLGGLALGLAGCGEDAPKVERVDVNVIEYVKLTNFEFCPLRMLGEIFDGYFDNSEWSFGSAGAGRHFVVATGDFFYDDKPAKAELVFAFEAGNPQLGFDGLKINGELQESAVAGRVFEAMCAHVAGQPLLAQD